MLTYKHTQFGKWYMGLLVVAVALFVAGLALVMDGADEELGVLLMVVGVILGILAPCFVALTVADRGDHLLVHFGPVRILRKRIPYADVLSVEPSRSTILEGWGLHLVPGRGWTWNIWGRDAVDVHLAGGNRVRIGTDDQQALLSFLNARLGPRPA